MKLWLDDVRTPPDDTWTWVKTVDDAIAVLTTGVVTHASLDHDLGLINDGTAWHPLADTGYDLVLWMADDGIWPTDSIVIHSANSVGATNMRAVVDRYGPYRKPCRWIPDWN